MLFTSKNGVIGFFELLKTITGTYQIPDNLKIAVIGKSTAKEVEKFNHLVDYTNAGITSEEFYEYLKSEVVIVNSKILLALGNLAPDILKNKLSEIGFTKRIDVYKTIKPDSFKNKILSLVKSQDADLNVFTSPSAFTNFIQTIGLTPDEYNMKNACIGKTTGSHIISKGYNVDLVASDPVIESFAKEIISYLNKKS